MTWLTWRQHRVEMLIMGVMLLGFAIALLVLGINITTEAQRVGFTGCMSQTTACLRTQSAMQVYVNRLTQTPIFSVISLVLPYILPALAGIFIGAPALSREFEQGTYRLVWTQSIPWSRWFIKKTSLLICTVTCAFAILFGLFSWWSAALFAPLSLTGWFYDSFNNRFDTWGVVIVAYVVFAVALGFFFGTVVRKPVTTMAITLLVFVVVRVLVTHYWRPYYLPPVVAIAPTNAAINEPGSSWTVSSSFIDRQGRPISIENALQVCSGPEANTCFKEHGIQTRTMYQPPERFWPFQWIESGIYLLFAAILIALTYGWTRYGIIGRKRKLSLHLTAG